MTWKFSLQKSEISTGPLSWKDTHNSWTWVQPFLYRPNYYHRSSNVWFEVQRYSLACTIELHITWYAIRFKGWSRCMVWATSKPYGYEYYEYILVYVDDLLVLSYQSRIIIETFKKAYRQRRTCTTNNLSRDYYQAVVHPSWDLPHAEHEFTMLYQRGHTVCRNGTG